MPLVKQNVEVFILGGQRIDQKRNKGWWRGSRERIEMEAQKVTELTIEEEDKEHLHLPLLVSTKVDGPSANYAQGAKNTLGNDVKTQKLSRNGITKVTILTFQNLAKQ